MRNASISYGGKSTFQMLTIKDNMEMTLHKTIGYIEWYKVNEVRFEGFNKMLHCYDYTLDKDICGLWILRGQGKDATGRDEQVLMDSIKD